MSYCLGKRTGRKSRTEQSGVWYWKRSVRYKLVRPMSLFLEQMFADEDLQDLYKTVWRRCWLPIGFPCALRKDLTEGEPATTLLVCPHVKEWESFNAFQAPCQRIKVQLPLGWGIELTASDIIKWISWLFALDVMEEFQNTARCFAGPNAQTFPTASCWAHVGLRTFTKRSFRMDICLLSRRGLSWNWL